MIVRANGKINIGLDILRRREDGYHDLETVMVPVPGWYDELQLERCEEEFRFEQRGLGVDCPPEENLCVRAFRLMQRRYGVSGLSILLHKQLPFGAGLGGGSADATAVLLGINDLFDIRLAEEELIGLAAELGSDTAFFVRNSPQLCSGRGECMEPIELPIKGLWVLLVKPDEGVSTREAYAGVKPAIPTTPLVERLQRPVGVWQREVENAFERSLFVTHPRLKLIKESLLAQGALYASMSGSGSTLFGLFDHCPDYRPPFENLLLHQERL